MKTTITESGGRRTHSYPHDENHTVGVATSYSPKASKAAEQLMAHTLKRMRSEGFTSMHLVDNTDLHKGET
jgi:hypothetical protein